MAPSYSPLLTDGDFEGKPNVLLLGQYSTGKTTFIKHLLGKEYPGCNIGPEPTTDRFVVVQHGPETRRTPGQTLAVQTDKPFTGLGAFGSSFLAKFEAAQCDAKLLEEVTIVDTPGVLSGEKQRIDRGYSFVQVCEWFAARGDVSSSSSTRTSSTSATSSKPSSPACEGTTIRCASSSTSPTRSPRSSCCACTAP